MVHVFIPTSEIQRENTINKTLEEVLESTADIIRYIQKHTDQDYLVKVVRTAAAARATSINVPDTVGVISPSGMKTLIKRIARDVDGPIDVHCHNNFGLAVANTIAAGEAGAS